MKLKTIVNAAPSLQKLVSQDVPIRIAYELAMLVDRLNPHLSFYGTEVEKCGRDEERLEAVRNLDATELGEIQKIQMPLTGVVTLSATDIKRLEAFVEFVPWEEF